MASQSELAAQSAGQEFDNAAVKTAAPLLKKYYGILSNQIMGLRPLHDAKDKKQTEAFDKYILNELTPEILAGQTDRAKKIWELLEKHAPENHAKLENASKVRAAMTQAVQNNTGDFEFLGGSTVMNAIVSLFQWMFSGFQNGFEGLKHIIAQNAVTNTINDFKANLQSQGINPDEGLGKEAVTQFGQIARAKAGLAPTISETSVDLSKVEIIGAGNPNPLPSAAKATGNPDKDLPKIFEKVVENTLTPLKFFITDNDKPKVEKARDAFIKVGTKLAKERPDLRNDPDGFAKAVINETKNILNPPGQPDAKNQIDPNKMRILEDALKRNLIAAYPRIMAAAKGQPAPEAQKETHETQAKVTRENVQALENQIKNKVASMAENKGIYMIAKGMADKEGEILGGIKVWFATFRQGDAVSKAAGLIRFSGEEGKSVVFSGPQDPAKIRYDNAKLTLFQFASEHGKGPNRDQLREISMIVGDAVVETIKDPNNKNLSQSALASRIEQAIENRLNDENSRKRINDRGIPIEQIQKEMEIESFSRTIAQGVAQSIRDNNRGADGKTTYETLQVAQSALLDAQKTAAQAAALTANGGARTHGVNGGANEDQGEKHPNPIRGTQTVSAELHP